MELKAQNLNIIEQAHEPHAHPEENDDKEVEARVTRSLHISVKHLRDRGYTDSCRRCTAHRNGSRQLAKSLRHTPACRQIIYKAIRDSGGDPRDAEDQQPKAVVLPKPKEVLEHPKKPAEVPETPHEEEVMVDDMPMPEQPVDHMDIPENEADIAEVVGDFDNKDTTNGVSMDAEEGDATEADQDHEMVAMIDDLQTLGVDAEAACRFSSDVIRTAQRP